MPHADGMRRLGSVSTGRWKVEGREGKGMGRGKGGRGEGRSALLMAKCRGAVCCYVRDAAMFDLRTRRLMHPHGFSSEESRDPLDIFIYGQASGQTI